MFDCILRFAAGLALLVFALIAALGFVIFIPYIAQAVLLGMH